MFIIMLPPALALHFSAFSVLLMIAFPWRLE